MSMVAKHAKRVRTLAEKRYEICWYLFIWEYSVMYNTQRYGRCNLG